MSLINQSYVENNITSDNGIPVPYIWSHGANSKHIGDGIVIYALVQQLRAKTCVCLGSGGGFIPRIMTQARRDLWEQGIFKGNGEFNWGDIGCTYVIECMNGVGGHVTWADEDSFYRTHFYPRFIKDTTENAFYNFFVKQDIKIDLLHIDADHSYEGVKRDFELYSTIMNPGGIITLHDTDRNYEKHLIVSEDNKKDWDSFDGPAKLLDTLDNSWEVVRLFNEGKVKDAPSSTGITIVQKHMPKLNLVTVIGDFHFPLTAVQMLKHYRPLVDRIVVNYYVTREEPGMNAYESARKFQEYLKENGVEPDDFIVFSGKKYDWNKVTDLYNATTRYSRDWWLIADCDEFQIWPKDPKEIIQECEKEGCTFVTGGFLDRIGEGGKFTEIKGPESNLDELFPLVGYFRNYLSGACPNKVVMVKGGQEVTSGQHYAQFPDGTNSWGTEHPKRYPVDKCFVQVHHFKWDSTVMSRLEETGKSGCNYASEFETMRRALERGLDISNPKYRIERFKPDLGFYSYKQWNEVMKEVISK